MATSGKSGKTNLPAERKAGALQTRTSTPLSTFVVGAAKTSGKLPNASIVYGIAASLLIVVAGFFILQGKWFTGLVILFPAACFLGFALHFIKIANRF